MVRLCFVPFAFKDLAKELLYSLAVDYITSSHDFIKVILKKILLHPKDRSNKNLVNRFEGTLNILMTPLSNALIMA